MREHQILKIIDWYLELKYQKECSLPKLQCHFWHSTCLIIEQGYSSSLLPKLLHVWINTLSIKLTSSRSFFVSLINWVSANASLTAMLLLSRSDISTSEVSLVDRSPNTSALETPNRCDIESAVASLYVNINIMIGNIEGDLLTLINKAFHTDELSSFIFCLFCFSFSSL